MVLVLVALLILYRLDRSSARGNEKFRAVQFISNPDGTADKWALVFIGAFVVSSWGLWQLIEAKELKEWFFNGYLYAFVIAALGNKGLKAWQAIQTGNAESKDAPRHRHGDQPPAPDCK